MTIVPATAELLARYYGEPLKKSVRGIVALKGDQPVAVCAAEAGPMCWKMFMDWKDEMRPFGFAEKRVLVGGFRKMLKLLNTELPIQALCDEEIPEASKLLEHLGFCPVAGNIYEWRKSWR